MERTLEPPGRLLPKGHAESAYPKLTGEGAEVA